MKSFRTEMIFWFGLVFWITTLLMLLLTLGIRVYSIADAQRSLMRRLAKNIIDEAVTSQAMGTDGGSDVFRKIEDRLLILDSPRERRLTYAIYGSDSRLLYRSPNFDLHLEGRYATEDPSRLFLAHVDSKRGWAEKLSVWHFVYRYQRDGYLVFVRSVAQFEFGEALMEGLLVVLLLTVIFAVPTGYVFARKVVTPLTAISQGVAQVHAGNLAARVMLPNKDNEFSMLVRSLNDTFQELEQSFRHIEQFSANVAHELRTPLTAIRGSLEVCLRKPRTVEEYRTVLASSVDEVIMLSAIVEDLLLLSRPGSREMFLRCGVIDFANLVENVLQAKEIPVDRTVQQKIATQLDVRGDEILLRRACLNLIHNALKFSPSEQPISVSLEAEGDFAVFRVTDRGPGIPQDVQQKIFERLYQVDPSRTNGSGLGLAIVQWIVGFHQGTVDLRSEVGVGTCVQIRLPLVRSA